MEFKSLKNIETSFRQIRLFGIIVISLCALVAVASVMMSLRFAGVSRLSTMSSPLTIRHAAELLDVASRQGAFPEGRKSMSLTTERA